MGMYTRLVLNVAVKSSATECVAELQRMVAGESTLGGRLGWMLSGVSSYYHDNIHATSFIPDDVSNCHKLSVVCDIKNYESEIERFCEWLAPHVETTNCAGYKRYEEHAAPDLLWFRDGKAVWHTPTLPPDLVDG